MATTIDQNVCSSTAAAHAAAEVSAEALAAAKAAPERSGRAGGKSPEFVVRATDGRILNTNDFLNLFDGYNPVVANIPTPPRPKRTRYTRAIENLRAAYKAKLDAAAAATATASAEGASVVGADEATTDGADEASAADAATAATEETAEFGDSSAANSATLSTSEESTASATAASDSESASDSVTAAASSTAPTFKKTTKRKSRARANKGHESAADSIRIEELATQLSGFTDAFKARAAADAAMLRALATAYEIALDRAIAAITGDRKQPVEVLFDNEDDQRVLSWHLHSIAGEFAIATHDSDQSLQHRAGDARLLAADFPA